MPHRPDTLCGKCGGRRPAGQPCPACKPVVRDQVDRLRGSAASRGYGGKRWRVARRARLRSSPYCECAGDLPNNRAGAPSGCGRHNGRCLRPADVADHWPRTRRELLAAGVKDPDRVIYLRSLCKGCHDTMTALAASTRGGWNARASNESADAS